MDEKPDESLPEEERVIKIELNDTNRPDLWSTAGLARQLRTNLGGKNPDYRSLMSSPEKPAEHGNRVVTVDPGLKDIRPFMTAFVISGKPIDEPMLLDIIQTQEKLCWNFGRKRRSISMGVYRSAKITWPVHYSAVDPDTTSFVPLACEEKMTCRQILSEHPKGKEYGWILENAPKFPLLTDDKGEVLSMAPIINSATLGAVKVGDSDLLVEMTGTDMPSLLLATNIVCCDFVDAGYTILPVKVEHPYETGFGLQLWKSYGDRFQVSLESPSGIRLGPFRPEPGARRFWYENTKILVYYGEPSPYSLAQEIYMDFIPEENYVNGGIWRIFLEPERLASGQYDLWLPSYGILNTSTRFLQSTPEVTLTIPSTADRVISVAAYDAFYESYADFSGRGNVYGGRFAKPDLAAPGVDISTTASGGGYESVTGTSFAAPFVTGTSALLMQWGIKLGNDPYLYGEKVKASLIRGARHLSGFAEWPNSQLGYGALCAADSIL